MKTRSLVSIALLTLSVSAFAGSPALSTVTPNSLTFSVIVNAATNPNSQQLMVNVDSTAFDPTWTAFVTVNTPQGGNWATIDNMSGSGSGAINVSVNNAGLPQGDYSASVTVQVGQEPQIIVPVTFHVEGTMTFNANQGSNPPTQTLALSVASSGTFTATWTATVSTSSGGNWLVLSDGKNSSTGNPPTLTSSATNLIVSPNVTGLAVGTYSGLIMISNATPSYTQVTLIVAPPAVTLAPTSLTFGGTFGSTNPTPQAVTVTTPNGWTATASTQSGGSWLTLTPSSGTGNGSFQASVSLNGLNTGQYLGGISVQVGSSTPVTMSVTLSVAGPTISATPSMLTFTQVEGTNAAAQSVQLAATPATSTWLATAQVSSNVSWLSATPSGGVFPASILVFPNSASQTLTAGSYQGTVNISDPNGSPMSLNVTVNLTVTAASVGSLTVLPVLLSPQTLPGINPPAASISVGNSGSGSLSWTATSTTLNGGNWLSVSPNSGSATLHAPAAVQVNYNAANLKPGIYSGQVSVATGSAIAKTVSVLLTVTANGPLLLLGQSGVSFTMAAGSTPQTQTVTIANPGSASENIYTNIVSGSDWLSFSATVPFQLASGGTTSFTITANPKGQAAGPHYGALQISQGGTTNPLPPQYICVLMNITATPSVTVYPVGLILTPNQLQQSFTLFSETSISATMSARTLSGGNWLSVGPSTATVLPSATVAVSAAGAGLPSTPGLYQGVVTVSYGSTLPSQDINVFLVIPSTSGVSAESVRSADGATCTPNQLIMAVRALGSNFASTVGWPVDLEAQVVDNCANPVTGATVLATFSTGDTPLALANVGGGIYSATWNPATANPASVTIQAMQAPLAPAKTTVPGTVAANTAPPPAVAFGGVVNGASFAPNADVAPGSIVSVFGVNLASSNGNQNSGFPLPVTLGGIKLSMGGIDMPLFFSATGQVNAQVPAELTPSAQTAVVARAVNTGSDETDSVPVPVTLGPAHPGIFIASETGASNQGAILNPNNTVTDSTNPTSVGQVIVIFCTGLGATTPAVATGAAAPASTAVTTPVTVTIGGVTATNVPYAGLAPGFVGLYQVNAVVPAGTPSGGSVSVVLTQNGIASNTATIAVH